MPVSECVIRRFAHLFIQLHREEATTKAHRMMADMRNKGDRDGADNWRRIIVAMLELGGAINLAPDNSNEHLARPVLLDTAVSRYSRMTASTPSASAIERTAHLFIQLHGDEATMKVREMVEEMRRRGDNDGADTWLRSLRRSANSGTAD